MRQRISERILMQVEKRFAHFQKLNKSEGPDSIDGLKQDVMFFLLVGDLLNFCERDTILGLFQIKDFSDLPDAQKIEGILQNSLLKLVTNVYLTAGKRIKNKYKEGDLTISEKAEIEGSFDSKGNVIPGLSHHILGVFTSLLQMYYAIGHEPIRLDPVRLQLGSRNVTYELASIFKRLHPENHENSFRKWAFITLFHDIAKIEESYSVLKHDVTSARFLKEQGIIDLLELSEEEKKEVGIIIEKHVDIGCHGPGDQSVTSLIKIFEDNAASFFTHEDGGNINPEKLERFLSNALLMWTHDSAGTTRKGLATILPFDYLKEVFRAVKEIAKSKNRDRHLKAIKTDLMRSARKLHYNRMGRIICAWLFSESATDQECSSKFSKSLERISNNQTDKNDIKIFEEYFPIISGKNHIFNMLMHPIRKSLKDDPRNEKLQLSSYDLVAKSFVILTKILYKIECEDIRAVNKELKMELNASKREQMAYRLSEVIEKASDIDVLNDTIVLLDGNRQVISSDCEFIIEHDSISDEKVLLVRV